jgi:hypothetical protein
VQEGAGRRRTATHGSPDLDVREVRHYTWTVVVSAVPGSTEEEGWGLEVGTTAGTGAGGREEEEDR